MLLNFINRHPLFKDYLEQMAEETKQGRYTKKIIYQRCIMRIHLAQLINLNTIQKTKGGVVVAIGDRTALDSVGFCTVEKMPKELLNKLLPISLTGQLGKLCSNILFFNHTIRPKDLTTGAKGKKLVAEKMSGNALQTYYQLLTTSTKEQYSLFHPPDKLTEVSKLNPNSLTSNCKE